MSALTLMQFAAPIQRASTSHQTPLRDCAMGRRHAYANMPHDSDRSHPLGMIGQLKSMFFSVAEPARLHCDTERGHASVVKLFDLALQDDRFTPLSRVWIARLQTSVMHEDWSSLGSFEAHEHPALRLLARFGSCVSGINVVKLPCGALGLR